MAGTVVGKPKVHFNFESWGEFIDHACNAKSLLKNGERESRSGGGGHFSETNSWEDAVELAIMGWGEGAERAGEIAEAVFESVTSMIEKTVVKYDVEGNGLDIGRYLDGEPECWQKFEVIQEEGCGQKVIKMVVNMSLSGSVPAARIVRRGAAVLAAIEALEFAGHRVELWATDISAMGVEYVDTWVLVKRAGENLDKPRVAFAVSHPAMLRRMIFSVMETLETKELLNHFDIHKNGGYGGVGDPLMESRGDIFINGGWLGEPYWVNDEAVKAWVMDQLRNQGVVLRKEGARK